MQSVWSECVASTTGDAVHIYTGLLAGSGEMFFALEMRRVMPMRSSVPLKSCWFGRV